MATLRGPESGRRIGPSYALRTMFAAVISLVVSRWLHIGTPIWAVVSAVVVIVPEHHASVANAALRVVANLVGAGIGLAVGIVGLPSIPSLLIGLPIVAGLCRLFGLDAAVRSASVSVIIVLLRDPHGVLGSSESRVVQVLLGCLIALAISIVAARIERVPHRAAMRNRSSPRNNGLVRE
jgi:uncharacterized membrane protein YgaE (UPF0421/DUF939 family)